MTDRSNHVLIVRNERNRHEFERYDFHDGLWFPCPRPRPLRAIISDIVSELRKAPFALAVSPCRPAEAFIEPDAVSLPDDGAIVALLPFEPPCTDYQLSRMRIWRAVTWTCADAPPIVGARVREHGLAAWLESFFQAHPDTLRLWTEGRIPNLEIWIRPDWTAEALGLVAAEASPAEPVAEPTPEPQGTPTEKPQRKPQPPRKQKPNGTKSKAPAKQR
jgi:hypothetical protein